MTKHTAFFLNARLLWDSFGIVPLMYGSLGLEQLTGRDLKADDIDILIPQAFLDSRWPEFRSLLEGSGYALTDLHEHTFEKEGIHYSYAGLEELEAFAGIPLGSIGTVSREGATFRLLTLEQYRKVYTASARDGYRIDVKEKQDQAKLALIESLLRQ